MYIRHTYNTLKFLLTLKLQCFIFISNMESEPLQHQSLSVETRAVFISCSEMLYNTIYYDESTIVVIESTIIFFNETRLSLTKNYFIDN